MGLLPEPKESDPNVKPIKPPPEVSQVIRKFLLLGFAIERFKASLDRGRSVDEPEWPRINRRKKSSKPSTPEALWEVAELNYRTLLEVISKAMAEVEDLPPFEGKAEAYVCVSALYLELFLNVNVIERAFQKHGPSAGLRTMHRVLRRARWTLRPSLALTCARLELGMKEYVAKAMGSSSAAIMDLVWTPFVTSARLSKKFREAGLPGSWDTIKKRENDGELRFHPDSTRGSWSLLMLDLPEQMQHPGFWDR